MELFQALRPLSAIITVLNTVQRLGLPFDVRIETARLSEGGSAAGSASSNLQTAWVDPARCCLPVRMEQFLRTTLDGREAYRGPAHNLVENVAIEQVADGVWYPRSSSMTQYANEPGQELPKFSLTAIREGKAPAGPSGIWQTVEWKVHKVEPRLQLAGDFFALPFSNGSILVDHATNRLVAVGDRSAVLDRMVAAPGMVTGDQPTSRMFIWLIGANVLVLVLIIVARRMNKKRRPPGARQGSI